MVKNNKECGCSNCACTFNGNTHIVFLLDKSGSMLAVRDATISGFNEFLNDQKRLVDDKTFVTLTTFDTKVKNVYSHKALSTVPELTTETYLPSGNTALYDAIGLSVSETETNMQEGDRALFIIFTDGNENASVELNRDQIFNLIKKQEKTGSWTFTYLGANQDAWQVANSFGMQHNAINYSSTAAGTAGAMRTVSASTTSYRSGSSKFVKDMYGNVVHVDEVSSSRP